MVSEAGVDSSSHHNHSKKMSGNLMATLYIDENVLILL